MTTILLLDDEIIFTDSLRFMLLQEMSELSISSFTSIQSAGNLHHRNQVKEYDFVFIDLNMKNGDVEKTIQHFLSLNSKIILFVSHLDNHLHLLLKLLTYDLHGVLLKTMDSKSMLAVIKLLFMGERYLPQSISLLVWNKFISLHQPKKIKRPTDLLSEREWEILEFISLGMSNRTISKNIFLSENTIKNNIATLFKKIGVKDRTSAAIIAYTRGWL
ncbi:response regulator transcription factor [Rossellomorea sp. LJF3]|uniref:response regulator transcription factor n=1 Tax=Rossellomorea sp. LJF3 TaxID=3126099 RepID=UPI00300D86E3